VNPDASTSDQPRPINSSVKDERRVTRFRVVLAILSGTMLGFSFPPSPFGILACFGLVPLLIVLADFQNFGPSLRHTYIAMLVFHLITLNWIGGYVHGHDVYMMIAGAITMILHPFFYFIPMSAYILARRYLGDKVALVALPFLWVGYEYLHSLSQWSFPWLTIGNSQSYDLAAVQLINLTGIYGLSFWILVINVLAYWVYSKLAQQQWASISWKSLCAVALMFAVYAAPRIYGAIVLSHAPSGASELSDGTRRPIRVGMIQSNVDPWKKWNQSGSETLQLYLSLTRSLVESDRREGAGPDLVVWPETAVPYYILRPSNRPLLNEIRSQIDEIGVPVLTGLPHAVFYSDPTSTPRSAKRIQETGERYDAFNAAALLEPGTSEIQWYGKMKMVPLAERVPYAEVFAFLDFLQWGVGIGGWQIGPDSTIFVESRTGTRFCTMICYESTYPDFVASFVRKGAEFIAIITIDSWWDKMSGAYQHQQFSIFRAVENRRWIARCAVGGISCFIDPYGRVYDRTELFTQAALVRTIGRSTQLSFYTAHGDWLAQIALLGGGMFVAAALGQMFRARQRKSLWVNHT
jgi:apolipoprotein N-acyltransferase